MRTTFRMDEDLARELKARALKEGLSLNRLVNRLLRRALSTPRAAPARRRFRQETFAMGAPAFDMSKALAFAADLESEEILRKKAMRK